MNAIACTLQDYRNIWRVTTVQQTESTVKLVRRLALLILFGGATVVAITLWHHKMDDWIFARLLVGGLGCWAALLWALLYVPGSMRLNSAIHARLLPRQRRRLMQMTGGGWLLLTLAFTAVLGSWTAFPVIGIHLLSFVLLFSTGNPRTGVPMLIVGNWGWVSRRLLPPALVEVLTSDAAMAVLTVLLVPIAAWTLRWLYPAGGDAHFDRHLTLHRQVASFQGQGGSSLDQGRGTRAYAAALRRDCRHGTRGADPGRMLMHALGPSVHWSAWTGMAAVMLAVGIAIRLLLAWQDGGAGGTLRDAVDHGAAIGLGMLMLMILFSTAAFSQAITRTRGEQALLRLAPLAGDAALLNRRLAGQLLQRALGLWIMLGVAILCVSALVAGPAVLLRQFGLCCLAGQVTMMGLLGDYAGKGGWHAGLAWRAAGLALLEVLAAAGLALVSGVSIWLWVAAIAVGMAAFQLRRSWQRMLAAPVAFPARRMG
jgi:hypothetical protein